MKPLKLLLPLLLITVCSLHAQESRVFEAMSMESKILGMERKFAVYLPPGYEYFFFDELMPFVESQYRIKKEKRFRAIAGLSMGGGGTYFYAMHRPDLFSSACPLSAVLRNTNFKDYQEGLKKNNVEVKDPSVLQGYFDRHQALRHLEVNDLDDIKSVKWYFDCGDDDFFTKVTVWCI